MSDFIPGQRVLTPGGFATFIEDSSTNFVRVKPDGRPEGTWRFVFTDETQSLDAAIYHHWQMLSRLAHEVGSVELMDVIEQHSPQAVLAAELAQAQTATRGIVVALQSEADAAGRPIGDYLAQSVVRGLEQSTGGVTGGAS